MARFNKSESELITPYDKWMYLFKNMADLKSKPDIFSEKEFNRLFEIAEFVNFTAEQYREYQKAEKMLYDYHNTLDYARRQGLEQGLREGLEQGKKEERLEIARRMLEVAMPIGQIVDLTGLSMEEIESL